MPNRRQRRTGLHIALLAVLVVALAAHIYLGYLGDARFTYAGPLLALDHLFDLFAVAALLAVCTAVGRAILVRTGVAIDRPIETLLFAALAGMGVVGTVILALGALRLLDAVGLGVLFVVLILAVRHELAAFPELAAAALSRAMDRLRESSHRAAFILPAAFLLFVGATALLLSMGPPVDWDSLMYHLRLPQLLLSEGRLYAPADNLHILHFGPIHALYVPLLAVGSAPGPAILSLALALLLSLAVFSLCDRLLDATTGVLGVVLLWGTPTFLLVAVTPRVDVTLALFLFAAHYSLLVSLEERSHRHLYLAAVLLGLAIAVKINAVPYSLALVPLAIWASFQLRGSRLVSLSRVVGFGGLVALVALPWLAKNWLLLGVPFAPFFSDRLLEPWLASFYSSPTVPTSIGSEIFQLVWEARSAFNIRDAFFAPDRISIEREAIFYFTSPALLLLPLWLFFVRNRTLNWLMLPAVAYLALVLIPEPYTNLRYLLPAIVPFSIVVAHVLVSGLARFDSPRFKGVLLALGVLAGFQTAIAAQFFLGRSRAIPHAVGVASASEYVRTHWNSGLYGLMLEQVNSRLEPTDRLLMFFEARGFRMSPRVIQDNRSSNWFFLEPALRGNLCLDRAVATHALVATGAVGYYMRFGTRADLLKWGEMQSFARRCLVPIYQHGGFELFEVRPSTPGPAPAR